LPYPTNSMNRDRALVAPAGRAEHKTGSFPKPVFRLTYPA